MGGRLHAFKHSTLHQSVKVKLCEMQSAEMVAVVVVVVVVLVRATVCDVVCPTSCTIRCDTHTHTHTLWVDPKAMCIRMTGKADNEYANTTGCGNA